MRGRGHERERERGHEHIRELDKVNRSVTLFFMFTQRYAYHIWENLTFLILLINSEDHYFYIRF